MRNTDNHACFLNIKGERACASEQLTRETLTTTPGRSRSTHPGTARVSWMKQMRLTRRKFIYALAAATLIILISNQLISYVILSETTSSSELYKENRVVCSDPFQEPIDVVYTWVNGSEERFQADLRRYSGVDTTRPDAYSPKRFHDKQELKYSLRSLEMHMPWVRHVYIVTNGQIPAWLDLDYPKVSIITHEEIFPNLQDLPTFSSPAIEANLHRIPGLSNKFIYFNDDVFLNDKVYPEDFHTRNRGFKIYTAWGADCARKCEWGNIGNDKCDTACYNEDCDFDGGDCDEQIIITANITDFDIEHININATNNALFFLTFETNSTNNNKNNMSALGESIKHYNDEHIKRQKQMRVFQRERNNFHIKTINKMAAKLFPGVFDDGLQSFPTFENETTDDETDVHARKDLYSSSLIFTQKLLGRSFGFVRRYVIAHAPLMIDKKIMAEVQNFYPTEFANTMANKFRHEDNLQIAFVYSYYLALANVEKGMEAIFDEYDTDHSGTWSDREIQTILTRVYPSPLKIEMVMEFHHILINCSNALTPEELQIELERPAPEYERYDDSILNKVTRNMVIKCDELINVLSHYERITHRLKYKHEYEEAAEHVSFNQLHSAAAAAMEMLNGIRRTPKKFVCINDDLDRTNATFLDNDLLISLLEDFFMSLFPIPSRFELPPEFRNRYGRVEELHAWEKWVWRWNSMPFKEQISYIRSAFVVIFTSALIVALVQIYRIIPASWHRIRRLRLVQVRIDHIHV